MELTPTPEQRRELLAKVAADLTIMRASNGWYLGQADAAANRVEAVICGLVREVERLREAAEVALKGFDERNEARRWTDRVKPDILERFERGMSGLRAALAAGKETE